MLSSQILQKIPKPYIFLPNYIDERTNRILYYFIYKSTMFYNTTKLKCRLLVFTNFYYFYLCGTLVFVFKCYVTIDISTDQH